MNLFFMVSILSILDPFVKLMGFIINYIYKFLLLFGITKVAVCIIVFTIVIKLVTLPLTYKQQKFSKVSAKMNPEIQAISEKYKGKKDQESMNKMQMEQQAVYKKYGASPMSGCLPMIVLMIILFALYPVIYSIPTYVEDVQTYYGDIVSVILIDKDIPDEIVVDSEGTVIATDADAVEATDGTTTYNLSDAIYNFYSINGVYVRKAPDYDGNNTTNYTKSNMITIMAGFSGNAWNTFFEGEELTSSKYDATAWNVYAPYIKEALSKETVDSEGNTILPSEIKDEIVNINTFVKLNIFDTPKDMMGSSKVFDNKTLNILVALAIPVFAALLQFLQTKISLALNKTEDNKKKKKKSSEPDPMDSMKTMNVIMPIFSGIICFSLPIGVGIYWITSAFISIILQIIINFKLKNVDIQVFVDESEEKNKKYLEKQGVHTENSGAMANVAKTSTKGISSKASYNNSNKESKKNSSKKDYVIPEEKRHLKANSISAIANIYNNDNDYNSNDESKLNTDSEKED